MCTVSYIPVKDGFILTSNRDEHFSRASLPPDFYQHDGVSLYYPQDPQSKGTWIAMAEDERVVCLLNGAFHKHKHQPPYNRSRGLVLVEAFQYETAFDFYQKVNLEGVEPFTMVMVWAGRLFEVRWDGKVKHFLSLPNLPYLWASATLYEPEVLALKRSWLENIIEKNPVLTQEELVDFHEHGGIADAYNGMRIDRENGLKTLSITSIQLVRSEVTVLQNTFSSALFEDSWSSQFADERF